jgi:hypothetical protein
VVALVVVGTLPALAVALAIETTILSHREAATLLWSALVVPDHFPRAAQSQVVVVILLRLALFAAEAEVLPLELLQAPEEAMAAHGVAPTAAAAAALEGTLALVGEGVTPVAAFRNAKAWRVMAAAVEAAAAVRAPTPA